MTEQEKALEYFANVMSVLCGETVTVSMVGYNLGRVVHKATVLEGAKQMTSSPEDYDFMIPPSTDAILKEAA